MAQFLYGGVSLKGMPVNWKVDDNTSSNPTECLRRKLFDFDEDVEGGKSSGWASSLECFSHSSGDMNSAMSDNCNQTSVFDGSPKMKVCV